MENPLGNLLGVDPDYVAELDADDDEAVPPHFNEPPSEGDDEDETDDDWESDEDEEDE